MIARITVVGSLNMDLVVRAAQIPKPGETIIGGDLKSIPGGKGANQAVAAARLGSQVYMVGRLGDDLFAQQLLENLKTSGVDTTHVMRDAEAATGVALIVVDEQGENSIVVASGANMRMKIEDVAAAEAVISEADVLLLQLEVPVDVVSQAVEIAKRHHVTVILNPAPARPLPGELLELVDVLVPNESETALLTGLSTDSQDDLAKAAERLLGMGVGSIVITLGARGAMMATAEEQRMYPAFEVEPVDTTAAGDAFMAGLAVAIGAGESLPDSIRWANAAGALATMRFGAQTSLPSREEVVRLLTGKNPDMIVRRQS